MSSNLKTRLPRLDIWYFFGAVLNPIHWGDGSEQTLRPLMASPVAGFEEKTELGVGVAIFTEFRVIFHANGVRSYEEVENSIVRCLRKAYNILKSDKALSKARVDHYAKVLTPTSQMHNEEYAGSLFIEIYLLQKVSNGVCESFGKIGNLYREGVRAVRGRMGILFLEANLRLHLVSPLEKAYKWFEYIRTMLIKCLSQKTLTSERINKRKKRKETVEPLGNEAAESLTSKSLAKTRRISSRLTPLLEN